PRAGGGSSSKIGRKVRFRREIANLSSNNINRLGWLRHGKPTIDQLWKRSSRPFQIVPLAALDTDRERQLNKLLAASDQADAALELGEFAARKRVASTSRTSAPTRFAERTLWNVGRGPALLRLDVGRPDDRPPLVDLRLVVGIERLRRLL